MLGWRQSAGHSVQITRCTENKDCMVFECKQKPVRMVGHNVMMSLMTGSQIQVMIKLEEAHDARWADLGSCSL